MSRNIIFVLMYHRHKLLDLTVSNKLFTNPVNHQGRTEFIEFEKIKE
jgi:hypothetical protein